MEFKSFERAFRRDVDLSVANSGTAERAEIASVVSRFGGSSFNKGIYRVIRAFDMDAWNERVVAAFPSHANRIACFGYDWAGSVFAVDLERQVGDEHGVVLFEPGTGEALIIPLGLTAFHNAELVKDSEAALAQKFYKRWLAKGGDRPTYQQCVGYKLPLFLGGADDLSNLSMMDTDVYWSISAQLIGKARGLPVGTPIDIRPEPG